MFCSTISWAPDAYDTTRKRHLCFLGSNRCPTASRLHPWVPHVPAERGRAGTPGHLRWVKTNVMCVCWGEMEGCSESDPSKVFWMWNYQISPWNILWMQTLVVQLELAYLILFTYLFFKIKMNDACSVFQVMGTGWLLCSPAASLSSQPVCVLSLQRENCEWIQHSSKTQNWW